MICTKLARLNFGVYKFSRTILRNVSNSSCIKQINNETTTKPESQEDIDWFSNSSKLLNDQAIKISKTDDSFQSYEKYSNLLVETDKDKKKVIVQKIIDSFKSIDFTIPNDFDEIEWDLLVDCNTVNELRLTLKKIPKDRYYKLIKAKRKLLVEKRRESLKPKNENGFLTNYPGNLSFLRHIDKKHSTDFLRHKLLASIRTNAPTIVFDFRYQKFHEKRHLLSSLYRQYVEVIHSNRNATEPFQVHFCNYDIDGTFHKTYHKELNLDENLIQETSKSYMDLFPKEKLVYLSKDSNKPMKSFDPEKVYIVGSIIDSGIREDRFASYSQAKRDGIECLRLPIDENIKWMKGSKDLAMNHVFEVLTRLYNQKGWSGAFKALPNRFLTDYNKFK